MKKFLLALILFATPLAVSSSQPVRVVRWVQIPIDSKQVIPQGKDSYYCGFASIVNALKFGTTNEQKVFRSLKGSTDQEKMYMLDAYGVKPSKNDTGRRLTETGINPLDLCNSCNEIREKYHLEHITCSYLNRKNGETQENLLKRIRGVLAQSLKKGELPIISLHSQVAEFRWSLAQFFRTDIVLVCHQHA